MNIKDIPAAVVGIDSCSGKVCIASKNAIVAKANLSDFVGERLSALAECKRIVVSAPIKSVVTTLLTPPENLSKDKQYRVLRSLLSVGVPFDLDTCKYVFSKKNKFGYLSQTIRKSDLEAFLTGLNISANEVYGVAPCLWQYALKAAKGFSRDDKQALLMVGAKSSLLIFGEGNDISNIVVLIKYNIKEVARHIKINMGSSSGCLLVVGENNEEVLTECSEALKDTNLEIIRVADAEYFMAASMATYKSKEENFICNEVVSHSSLSVSTIGVSVLFVILLALSLFAFDKASQVRRDVTKSYSKILKELAGYSIATRGERGLSDAQKAMSERFDKDILRLLKTKGVSELMSSCMSIFEKHDVRLRHVAMEYNGLTASGVADSVAVLNEVISELDAMGVNVALTEQPKSENGKIRFVIHPVKR